VIWRWRSPHCRAIERRSPPDTRLRTPGRPDRRRRWCQRGVRNATAIGGLLAIATLRLNATDIVAIAAPVRDLPAAIVLALLRQPGFPRRHAVLALFVVLGVAGCVLVAHLRFDADPLHT
jgi:hypothetical protein